MVELEQMEQQEDIAELKRLIENHHQYTDSNVAEKILVNWDDELANFKKVMPIDYKRVLEGHRARDAEVEDALAHDEKTATADA